MNKMFKIVGLTGMMAVIMYGIIAMIPIGKHTYEFRRTSPIERCFYSEVKDDIAWVEMTAFPKQESGGMTIPGRVEGEFRYLVKDQKPIIGNFWARDMDDIAISKGKGLLSAVFTPRADDKVSPSSEEQLWDYMFRMDKNYLEVGIGEMVRSEGTHDYSEKKPTYFYRYKDAKNIATWKNLPEVSCEVLNSKTGITRYDRPEPF